MESTQKFDCWEELSDEELASISGGTLGLSASDSVGSSSVGVGNGGVSVGTKGVGGSTNVGATGDTLTYNGHNDVTGKEIAIGATPSSVYVIRT